MGNCNGGFIPFTNDFMFSLVMKDPEICMEFLKLIMPEEEFSDIKIVGSEFDESDVEIDTQAVLKFAEMAKGVRLDVYIKSQNSWAEIEMQNYKGTVLPKRSRFYQANMDIDALNRGRDYDELPKGYVIFMCTYDYIGMNEPIYYYENIEKNLGLPFGDGTYKIVLNTKCPVDKIPEKLRPLYEYINNPKTENQDEFVKKLDGRVKKYNSDEWRRKLMTVEELMKTKYKIGHAEGREEGKEEGRKEGREESKKETAQNLKKIGMGLEQIAEVLNVDERIVREWLEEKDV